MSVAARAPWITLALLGCAATAETIPSGAAILEYDRVRVASGEVWRLLTGQLVHWTARMALVDLAAILALGAWLESRSRPRALAAAAAGTFASALAVHVVSTEIPVYRGSSGIASALFACLALDTALRSSSALPRALAIAALSLFAIKIGVEGATGAAILAGPLPEGVRVVSSIHAAGGLSGVLAALPRGRRAEVP